MKWLNKIIKKIRETFWSTHQICYQEMEDKGIAFWGNCCGSYGDDKHNFIEIKCINCPYFVEEK